MICLPEQYGYKETDSSISDKLSKEQLNKLSDIKQSGYIKHVIRKKEKECSLCISFDEKNNKYKFQTSYFIGVDWIIENKLSVCVQPKQNNELYEVNYMKMLLDALQESENLKHLDDLVHIDFHKPYILIEQKKDRLSPFLIAQFLHLLKIIVQKGLKKSYYMVTDNINSRVKGKILIGRNVKENVAKGKLITTICQYQEFGVNCDENKILKKAYQFSRRVIQQYGKGFETQSLLQLINYIHPAFENVSDDIEITKIKRFKSNALFKEYDQALKLALLILKRFSYNITKTEQQFIMTPPFWIDMSKLFELYVYKKLRNIFSADEVIYHMKAKYQELDFVLKSHDKDCLFVIDTKYKPKYNEHNINIEDIRQVCGYARLEKVYREMSISDRDMNINCLIIYSHQDCDDSFQLEHFLYNETNDNRKIRKENGYVNFYKLGIRLPQI